MRFGTLTLATLGLLACTELTETRRADLNLSDPGDRTRAMTICLDQNSGINGDFACLAMTEAGVTDALQRGSYSSYDDQHLGPPGRSGGRERIRRIRERARNAVALGASGCSAPNPDDNNKTCPPHRLTNAPTLTWPHNGQPWLVYGKKPTGGYQACPMKNCDQCHSTVESPDDCHDIVENLIPESVLDMLKNWGMDKAY